VASENAPRTAHPPVDDGRVTLRSTAPCPAPAPPLLSSNQAPDRFPPSGEPTVTAPGGTRFQNRLPRPTPPTDASLFADPESPTDLPEENRP